jgi:hypothetical protein
VREELRADSGPARSWTSIMASTKRSVRFVKRWAIQSRVRASLRPLPVVARPKYPAFVDLTHAGALQKRSLGPYAWRLVGFVLALVVTVSLSWIFYSRNQYSLRFAPWQSCQWTYWRVSIVRLLEKKTDRLRQTHGVGVEARRVCGPVGLYGAGWSISQLIDYKSRGGVFSEACPTTPPSSRNSVVRPTSNCGEARSESACIKTAWPTSPPPRCGAIRPSAPGRGACSCRCPGGRAMPRLLSRRTNPVRAHRRCSACA